MFHFRDNHSHTDSGRFVVPLPKKPHAKANGKSRSQAKRQFLSLKHSLHTKNQFGSVMKEDFNMGHAEPVPPSDLEEPQHQVFYLPMYAIHKDSSTTTKIRAVFDASAKSSSGVSRETLRDYRMTRVMFGVSISSFAVNISVRQNATDLAHKYPLTAKAVDESFYVDDGLTSGGFH